MMRLLSFIILVFILNVSFAQMNDKPDRYFGKTFDIGNSLTLMLQNDLFAVITRYRELSWNTNLKMRLSKRFWAGAQIIPIFTKSTKGGLTKKENFNFYGAFVQASIYHVKNFDLFVETSFNRSNLLLQANDRPKKVDGINYIGFGGGLNTCLNYSGAKNIFLEVGFYNYHPLNDLINKSNYTQYILGLNYRLGKK